jgi:hypothetical protein
MIVMLSTIVNPFISIGVNPLCTGKGESDALNADNNRKEGPAITG